MAPPLCGLSPPTPLPSPSSCWRWWKGGSSDTGRRRTRTGRTRRRRGCVFASWRRAAPYTTSWSPSALAPVSNVDEAWRPARWRLRTRSPSVLGGLALPAVAPAQGRRRPRGFAAWHGQALNVRGVLSRSQRLPLQACPAAGRTRSCHEPHCAPSPATAPGLLLGAVGRGTPLRRGGGCGCATPSDPPTRLRALYVPANPRRERWLQLRRCRYTKRPGRRPIVVVDRMVTAATPTPCPAERDGGRSGCVVRACEGRPSVGASRLVSPAPPVAVRRPTPFRHAALLPFLREQRRPAPVLPAVRTTTSGTGARAGRAPPLPRGDSLDPFNPRHNGSGARRTAPRSRRR